MIIRKHGYVLDEPFPENGIHTKEFSLFERMKKLFRRNQRTFSSFSPMFMHLIARLWQKSRVRFCGVWTFLFAVQELIRSILRTKRRFRENDWKNLQLDKQLQIGYNSSCLRETNSEKEVGKMFFFSCNTGCNTNCNAIWQILSQICGFGC